MNNKWILLRWLLLALLAAVAVLVTDWQWPWLTALANLADSNAVRLGYLVPIVAVLLAVLIGISQIAVGRRQARISERHTDMTECDLLDKRLQAGLETLESDSVRTRCRGIESLSILAAAHPRTCHERVMHEFAKHVRRYGQSATERPRDTENRPGDAATAFSETPAEGKLRDDLQAIMDVIGARNSAQRAVEFERGFALNLEGADIRHLVLSLADLSGVNLENADLSHARLTGVDLSNAWLKGTRLCHAILDHVNCDNAQFWMTKLNHVLLLQQVSMRDTKLREAEFNDADARGADMHGAYVFGADISGTIFSKGGDRRVANLTQYQLDQTCFDGKHEPVLRALVDPDTEQPLRPPGSLRPRRSDDN